MTKVFKRKNKSNKLLLFNKRDSTTRTFRSKPFYVLYLVTSGIIESTSIAAKLKTSMKFNDLPKCSALPYFRLCNMTGIILWMLCGAVDSLLHNLCHRVELHTNALSDYNIRTLI